ncbi:MAG TPA: S8 family peptidase [Chryseolinea sp.]|nr:S8 family peptidase [Chryseolinea sp.]
MIFFKDKNGTSFNSSSPAAFLSQRAIDRRLQHNIAITEQDFPVNSNYVTGARNAGATPFFSTRWMNGVLVQCDASTLPSLESLPYVSSVILVAPSTKLITHGRRKTNARAHGSSVDGRTQAQLQLIGLDEMQAAGYRGETIHIGIFDSGFLGVNNAQPFQHIFNEHRIDLSASRDFVANSDNVFQYDQHGTEVLSVMAAYQEGTFTGGSYEAEYQLYVTEDVASEYRIEEYNWLFAAESADSAGVDVINSSLGYFDFDDASMNYTHEDMDGKSTVISKAAQWLADRGVVVVCSAGNEGANAWQIIAAPADARDVLAVASVNATGQRAGSSSKGPSADGRVKPDVAAMGVNTSVILPDGSPGNVSGTSLSSPLITSLAAGVWQRYPLLSNKEVIAAIRNSASQASSPDNLIGYGIPNFKAVVNYLERSAQENVFDVYPNPILSDTFTIRPSDPSQITACRIEVVSSQGQVVYNEDINFSWLNRSYTGNLGSVAAGYYILRIWWGEKRYTYKLVKV